LHTLFFSFMMVSGSYKQVLIASLSLLALTVKRPSSRTSNFPSAKECTIPPRKACTAVLEPISAFSDALEGLSSVDAYAAGIEDGGGAAAVTLTAAA